MSLHESLQDPIVLEGLAQAGAAAALAVVVIVVARLQRLGLSGELAVATARGFVQLVAMGAVVGLLLTAPLPWSGVLLVGMALGAAWISSARGQELPRPYRVAAVSVVAGAGLTIVSMTAAGAIRSTVRYLLPVGSMIIAGSMKGASLALDRVTSEVAGNRDRIEAALALGAPAHRAVAPHVRDSVRASLLPHVDTLKSLGWVWIPGTMAGMVLSGANPFYAAEYQFVIVAMILGSRGLTGLAASTLAARQVVTDAQQLRPIQED